MTSHMGEAVPAHQERIAVRPYKRLRYIHVLVGAPFKALSLGDFALNECASRVRAWKVPSRNHWTACAYMYLGKHRALLRNCPS